MIRPIILKECIQMEVTNVCKNRCSNCTRLVGHHKKPYHMDLDYFKDVIDQFRKYDLGMMIGFIGGEPLLHPQFVEMCEYVREYFPKAQLGLWSELPPKYQDYAGVIEKTFGAVLPNDHSNNRIFHNPVMVSSKNLIGDDYKKAVKGCWLQKSWSASVNPNGAFFCEVAAAIDMLLNTGTGFDVHTPWWIKKPWEYEEQIEALCSQCSVCLNLTPRLDVEGVDDIDTVWYDKLKEASPKMKDGKYVFYKGLMFDNRNYNVNGFRMDINYIKGIGRKFGLELYLKQNGYFTPRKAAS